MLDYKLLEAFYSVITNGGFEKAASMLCITQSAVSQRIKLLEEQTGQVLLLRSNPPKPTDEGFKYINHYKRVKTLEDDLCFLNPEHRDNLKLGINSDSLATWFMEAIGSILTDNINLEIHVDDQENTIDLLRNGDVAACISSSGKTLNGCSVIKIGTMKYRMLSTPEFRDKWFKDGFVKKYIPTTPSVVFNNKDKLHANFIQKTFSEDIKFTGHYIPSPEKFYEFILHGLSYGMVPDLQSLNDLHSGLLIDLCPSRYNEVELYIHRWNLLPKRIEVLLEEFINYIRDKNLLF